MTETQRARKVVIASFLGTGGGREALQRFSKLRHRGRSFSMT
jgi:hypothetical protein